ncbi:ATP phosphoribosyltransferase [Actinobacillus equuli]|nr:ATP phosphoribosyltransferase [Actinobacillus equuli]
MPIEILRVRDDDIPGLVFEGVVDLGIIGEMYWKKRNSLVLLEVSRLNIKITHLGFWRLPFVVSD